MRIETIAVGGPRTVRWQGDEVVTSIFKTPVPGPVTVHEHNLEGDRQSDLTVHGASSRRYTRMRPSTTASGELAWPASWSRPTSGRT